MLTGPIIKFIGEKEMVIPIFLDGYLLSHKDYVNHFSPTTIEIIDSSGKCLRYQTAKLLPGIQWLPSIQHASILYRILPEPIEDPFEMELEQMKEKVSRFIQKTPKNRGLIQEEKMGLLRKVEIADSHLSIIQTIKSVSYWR